MCPHGYTISNLQAQKTSVQSTYIFALDKGAPYNPEIREAALSSKKERSETMKYKDYIKQLEKLPHKSSDGRTIAEMYADNIEIWSNYAAIGYLKIALSRVSIDEESAAAIIKEMQRAFDDYSIEEAEQHY